MNKSLNTQSLTHGPPADPGTARADAGGQGLREGRSFSGVDWAIAGLFAGILTVPLAGESSLLLMSLWSLACLARFLMGPERKHQDWRMLLTLALAVGSITLVKAVSLLWSVDPAASRTNIGTHLHFVFWLPLTLGMARARYPLEAALLGARLGVLGLLAWSLWFWWQHGLEISDFSRLHAGAQNAGVLGQLATVFVLWLSWIWRCRPTLANLGWMLISMCPVIAAGGRTHIAVMVLGWLGIVLLCLHAPPRPMAWRVQVLAMVGVLLAAVVWLLSPRLELAWEQVQQYGHAPAEAVATSVGNRAGIYHAAVLAFPDAPWLGFGAGTTRHVVAEYATVDVPFAVTNHYHQQLIQVVLETGLLGLALCLAALGSLTLWFWHHRARHPMLWPMYLVLLYDTAAVGMFTGSLQQGLIHSFVLAVLSMLAAQVLSCSAESPRAA